MPKKHYVYSKEPAFINRKEELEYLNSWISQRPDNILFLFGPKSSGKTTLIMKFIEKSINMKGFDIKHFNLREIFIGNYSDFIQAFFEIKYPKSKEDIKEKREYNLKLFKLSKEVLKSLEEKTLDPFVVMKKELVKISEKGKRSIIMIDELQALDDIYLNGQRELLKELFNFFVAITKESHLCHVIIASSDGYFINRIYEDSKLKKTSAFFEVDYLNEKDTKYWLSHLKEESSITAYTLTDSQIHTIWSYFGGSVWEISFILGELLNVTNNNQIQDNDLMQVIQKQIDMNKGNFNYYAKINKSKKALLEQILSIQKEKEEFDENDLESLVDEGIIEENELTEELINLVRLNYLVFNPTTSLYKLQGKSMFYGLKEYFHETKKMGSISA